jgi:hypothetical protein
MTRNMLNQMEHRFKLVHSSPTVITAHMAPKLLAPGVTMWHLDAQLYARMIPSPLNGKPFCHTHQSWTCGRSWVMRMVFDNSNAERLTQLMWKMPDGLHSIRIYECCPQRAAEQEGSQQQQLDLPEGGVSMMDDEWLLAHIVKSVYTPVP